MKLIDLGRGLKTKVDDHIYSTVSSLKWRSAYCQTDRKKYYHARACVAGKSVILHRLITKCPSDMVVDHKNGDSLDNRLSNLRVCTQSQNSANRQLFDNKFKGIVYYHQPRCRKDGNSKRWKARIGVNGKRINLGWFHTPEEAAKAYDQAAIKYFGEFANLNFKENS